MSMIGAHAAAAAPVNSVGDGDNGVVIVVIQCRSANNVTFHLQRLSSATNNRC